MNLLKALLMMFYAPSRGFKFLRDEAPLAPAALIAVIAHGVFNSFYMRAPQLRALDPTFTAEIGSAHFYFTIFFSAAMAVLLIAVAFVPIAIFVVNFFQRRASFRIVLEQEFASVATCIFYAWAAASLFALPLAFIARASGFEVLAFESMREAEELRKTLEANGGVATAADLRVLFNLLGYAFGLFITQPLTLFVVWATLALREVFRLTWWRTLAVMAASSALMIPAAALLLPLFNRISGSIFLLLFAGILLRNYVGELTRSHRARADFRRNLEAATLNPADASAHYNLGLIHLDRKELTEARERFTRAVEIDSEETDSHYRLGRISRLEGKYAEAIEHFGRVVTQDQTHAQHEIWREIGATYLAAAQHEDATDALERFLDHRSADPEGLYLQGRALAALNRPSEARELMQRCVEAVRSAPAYKYRIEKRWMTEAQAFLRSQA